MILADVSSILIVVGRKIATLIMIKMEIFHRSNRNERVAYVRGNVEETPREFRSITL